MLPDYVKHIAELPYDLGRADPRGLAGFDGVGHHCRRVRHVLPRQDWGGERSEDTGRQRNEGRNFIFIPFFLLLQLFVFPTFPVVLFSLFFCCFLFFIFVLPFFVLYNSYWCFESLRSPHSNSALNPLPLFIWRRKRMWVQMSHILLLFSKSVLFVLILKYWHDGICKIRYTYCFIFKREASK